MTRLLTICGSLRVRSSNRAILRAFVEVVGDHAEVASFDALATLPHFNPDLDIEPVPETVAVWRRAVTEADALVISTPEYAHGLPGSFKNALDWLVSDPAFAGKRVAILHVERGSSWALDSLREILRTMSAVIVDAACVGLRLETNQVTAEELLRRDDVRTLLETSAAALLRVIGTEVSVPPGEGGSAAGGRTLP